MNFLFGHKSFLLPIEAVSNYDWLNSMFGNGSVGESKDTLKYNLNTFFTNIPSFKLRILIDRMTDLENYYQNDSKIENDEYMLLLENFLKYGPCGEDFEFLEREYYECTKCGLKCTKKPLAKQEILPHELHTMHSGLYACIYCGKNFGYQFRDISLCLRNSCNHDWK